MMLCLSFTKDLKGTRQRTINQKLKWPCILKLELSDLLAAGLEQRPKRRDQDSRERHKKPTAAEEKMQRTLKVEGLEK